MLLENTNHYGTSLDISYDPLLTVLLQVHLPRAGAGSRPGPDGRGHQRHDQPGSGGAGRAHQRGRPRQVYTRYIYTQISLNFTLYSYEDYDIQNCF